MLFRSKEFVKTAKVQAIGKPKFNASKEKAKVASLRKVPKVAPGSEGLEGAEGGL